MIYFIQDAGTYRIKIGYTGKDDPQVRLKELQTGSATLLYLLGTRAGTLQTEKELHEQFAKHSVAQGEWFNPAPELLQYIIGCATVGMVRQVASSLVSELVKKSFPETKDEIIRRRNAKAQEWIKMARENLFFPVAREFDHSGRRVDCYIPLVPDKLRTADFREYQEEIWCILMHEQEQKGQ